MEFLNRLSSLGSGLWQDAKNVGDFVGLDGSLGYQGTWNQPSGMPSLAAGYGFDNSTQQIPRVQSSSILGSLGDWIDNQNSQNWMHYGQAAKSLGGLGLGYLNYQNGKDMSDIYKQQMAFNQNQVNDAEDRRKKAQGNMQDGFANSSLATI